jgi:tetratricopeptide (TPR) repeat protein
MEMISEMLQKNPDDTFLNYAAALEHIKDDEPKKAIKIFKKIVKNDPDYLATYYQLGKLLEAQNKTAEAIEYYKAGRGLAREKNDPKAIGELSEALLLLDADDGRVY